MSLYSKILLFMMICVAAYGSVEFYITNTNRNLMEASLNQLKEGNTLDVQQLMWANNTLYLFGLIGIVIIGTLLFKKDIKKTYEKIITTSDVV